MASPACYPGSIRVHRGVILVTKFPVTCVRMKNCQSSCPAYFEIQVRMDGLHPYDPLARAHRRRNPHRLRRALHLPPLLQLPRRCLPTFVRSKFPPPRSSTLEHHAHTDFPGGVNRAASTVAANIMLRSAVAAGFPLFARQMFANLGVQWAGTLRK